MPGYRKLGRPTAHRQSMLRNLTTDLLREGRIQTTENRAKEVKRETEKLITMAKTDNLANRRRAMAYLYDETVVNNLFETIAPKYEDRQGGYTRILKLGPRRGDAAEVVFLELV
ncbi:MAG: 50S ribosomal protein L17 [Eubacterium sp.]|jgi:large subunit ribosomal protein L17